MSKAKTFAEYAGLVAASGLRPAREQVEEYGELWDMAAPGFVAPRRVGDLVGQPLAVLDNETWNAIVHGGRPREAWLIVDVLGGRPNHPDLGGARPDDPLLANGNYCYFAAIPVDAPCPDPVPSPGQRSDSALGEHLSRLTRGD